MVEFEISAALSDCVTATIKTMKGTKMDNGEQMADGGKR